MLIQKILPNVAFSQNLQNFKQNFNKKTFCCSNDKVSFSGTYTDEYSLERDALSIAQENYKGTGFEKCIVCERLAREAEERRNGPILVTTSDGTILNICDYDD